MDKDIKTHLAFLLGFGIFILLLVLIFKIDLRPASAQDAYSPQSSPGAEDSRSQSLQERQIRALERLADCTCRK